MTQTQKQAQTPNQMAEQLADSLWKTTAEWGEFAKSSIALPLMRAVDAIGLQLAMSLGRKQVKEHMQHVGNARKSLTPASYWLQRAIQRGLIDQAQAEHFQAQMKTLAKRLDEHAQTVVQAANEKIAEQKTKAEDTRAEADTQGDATAEQALAH